MIMGYSFLDEHVNDIIMNALSNPSLQLVIFTYSIEEYSSDFMKKLFQLAATDHRITIFEGNILGNFKHITNFLIPFSEGTVYEEVIKETLKVLRGAANE